MNAINVIIAFVILLGLLLYYLQRRNSMLETSRKEIENKREPQIKARDYQAKYEKEKALETKTETLETIPEQELGKETGTDNLSELEGVGSKYQELLRVAGYTRKEQIAGSVPDELYARIIEANNLKAITKRPPTKKKIEEWIESAKKV